MSYHPYLQFIKAIEIPYRRRDFDLVTLWQLLLILTEVRHVHQLIASEVKPSKEHPNC